jgi:uncharacterized protein with HEPN domain
MSERGDLEFLLDILEAGNRIRNYVGEMTYHEFLQDPKTQDAVVRNIEVIGEAVKNLSTSLKERQPAIEWKSIAGMRDRIIHFYFGINWEIVWSVVNDKMPEIMPRIEKLVKALNKG